MKESFSWITPKQAGSLSGYSARQIQNLIVAGKLAATKEDGKYYIDKAEFYRYFLTSFKKKEDTTVVNHLVDRERLEFEIKILKDEIKTLKEMNTRKDTEIDFLRNHIDFLRNQINFFSEERIKSLDQITK